MGKYYYEFTHINQLARYFRVALLSSQSGSLGQVALFTNTVAKKRQTTCWLKSNVTNSDSCSYHNQDIALIFLDCTADSAMEEVSSDNMKLNS